ncbi:unnamed protein product [Rotaria sp. Silwood1]|nr:unnamed protein product [Rotaria sp. Silwood1]CAF3336891.1 unnamed protein product [Rotaria sp. Silwood1]CAF3339830.1 unnamed protein product [Rotaria sp. Silwood1]CAF3363493.1 unnamed protein product [Rotaria sp. Silwood1]CAF4561806.1 unnamed protein product [Rotaria sp. Silwood1]
MSSSPPLVACWLDQNIGEANTHLALKKRFESISNRIVKWHYFESTDQFNEFINGNPNVKLVAIMSGHLARCLVSLVSDRDTLHSVYIFCGNKEKYKSKFIDEKKVKGIFDTEDDLYRQMQIDLKKEFP